MPSVPLPGEGGTKSPEAEKHQLKPILCKVIAQKEAFQVTLVVKNLLADAEDTRDAGPTPGWGPEFDDGKDKDICVLGTEEWWFNSPALTPVSCESFQPSRTQSGHDVKTGILTCCWWSVRPSGNLGRQSESFSMAGRRVTT